MIYAQPNKEGSKVEFKSKYNNYIGGEWVAPVKGEYFDAITPVTGESFCQVARSTAEDIELALDAAHEAKMRGEKHQWLNGPHILNKIADRWKKTLKCWQ